MIFIKQLFHAVAKEFKIILRDKEALAILFIFPAIFSLIMSLAMQDAFNEKTGVIFSLLIVNHDQGDVGESISNAFTDNQSFAVTTLTETNGEALPTNQQIESDLHDGIYQFAIVIPEKASEQAMSNVRQLLSASSKDVDNSKLVSIKLMTNPEIQAIHRRVVIAALNNALLTIQTGIIIDRLSEIQRLNPIATGNNKSTENKDTFSVFSKIKDPNEDKSEDKPLPTSVQQNAPAWALLAMFFIVIPLSSTLIRERQEGSLLRLQTMSAPISLVIIGKIIPFSIINQLQLALILLEGIYLLPLLGGEQLDLGQAPGAILLLAIGISFAAVGYGLAVAAFSRTTEQATIFGATSVLTFAALGGIMVPKLVMPAVMQKFTIISPLSWGLDGFMDIFVRGGNYVNIIDETLMLGLFGACCLFIAVLRINKKLKSL